MSEGIAKITPVIVVIFETSLLQFPRPQKHQNIQHPQWMLAQCKSAESLLNPIDTNDIYDHSHRQVTMTNTSTSKDCDHADQYDLRHDNTKTDIPSEHRGTKTLENPGLHMVAPPNPRISHGGRAGPTSTPTNNNGDRKRQNRSILSCFVTGNVNSNINISNVVCEYHSTSFSTSRSSQISRRPVAFCHRHRHQAVLEHIHRKHPTNNWTVCMQTKGATTSTHRLGPLP